MFAISTPEEIYFEFTLNFLGIQIQILFGRRKNRDFLKKLNFQSFKKDIFEKFSPKPKESIF